MKKIAIVLFNLGGPDSPQAVQPFLFNLFSDRAIIRVPNPLRFMIAKIISSRRTPIAQEIYAKIGGASPILKNTEAQAQALEQRLTAQNSGTTYKAFICMRYWHPLAYEAVKAVKAYSPDEIVLVPLYPQFSTTTTASSIADWHAAAKKNALSLPTISLCCYPQMEGFVKALAQKTLAALSEANKFGSPRILFSAHGLPEKIIKAGDPYQAQCALTVEALRKELKIDNLDSVLCFQSRVGPMQWIGPSTDNEIRRAGQDKVPLVVVPIAFVSDHSETLVEIDIEYRHLARQCGVPYFASVPTVGTASAFIEGLAHMIKQSSAGNSEIVCPTFATKCACGKTSQRRRCS